MRSSRILNADVLTSHGNIAGRRAVVEILEAGLQSADPYYTTRRMLCIVGDRLEIGLSELAPLGDPQGCHPERLDLRVIDRIFVFGAAKGVQRVASALEEVLGDRLTGGHVIAKHEDEALCERIGVTYGAHPVPDEGCVAGCWRIVELAREARLTERDLVFTIGGSGISALLTLPAAGVTLEEVRRLTYLMQIERGVPTSDLNRVRNHVDALKGGKISRHFRPAKVIHLVAKETATYQSFVGGRHFVHFFPDNSSFADAVEVLRRWQVWDEVPPSVRCHLTRADPAEETVKADEFAAMGSRLFCLLPRAGGMLPSAERRARELGFTPHRLARSLQVEASQAGLFTADIALNVAREGMPFEPPCALFSGGELLVTVGLETGMGGRNQEYALAAARRIAGSERIVMAAVDSDGTDGPGGQFWDSGLSIPCLAGGIVDGETLSEASAAGVDVEEALRRHDASPALWRLGSGVLATHGVSLLDLRVTLVMGQRS
jgi:glycerate 2-kinase